MNACLNGGRFYLIHKKLPQEMKKIAILLVLTVFVFTWSGIKAREGMWLPHLLGQLNEKEMQLMGMKISAEEIYSLNKSSLKDAVVHFGGGCTGEIISNRGLLLTNHHCGYSQIQSLSTLAENHLEKGYWASHDSLELPCKGLTATFIIETRDVTAEVLKALNPGLSAEEKDKRIRQIGDSLEKIATEGSHYKAQMKSMYAGNSFLIFISEVFTDVRLVGTPPNAVGNFGGDADNWMWPRHTGDFSLFRIYANKDNKPAPYSRENVPFHPRHHFPISLSGIQEGDFTMVFGFPGRTQTYIPSMGLDIIYSQTNPNRIGIRDVKLNIWNTAMQSNDTVKLQYASKYRSLSNHYKKWKGENMGLKKNDAVRKKIEEEKEFQKWVAASESRSREYGSLLKDFETVYKDGKVFMNAQDYYAEALNGIELVGFVLRFQTLYDLINADKPDTAAIEKSRNKLKSDLVDFFKNYNAATDEKLMSAMLELAAPKIPDYLQPTQLKSLYARSQKDKNAYASYAKQVFSQSMFVSQEKISSFLQSFSSKSIPKLEKDPAWKLARSISTAQKNQLMPLLNDFNQRLNQLQSSYMKALLEKNQGVKALYPDANSTIRVSYGKVEGMIPRDGMSYNYYSTLDGVIEKADSSDEEFTVPEKLMELYRKMDYGNYSVNGTVPVAFLASNHTTGGNSGSPVINARGELIGTNFDRIWEGVLSDLYYDENLGRNISVDIRYTLFIIEKLGGAERLIREMTLVKN